MGHQSNQLYADKVANLPRPTNSWPKWLVSGGGLGFLRPAPGSWGTVGPAALWWVAMSLGLPDPWRSVVFLLAAVGVSALLIRYGRWACAYFHEIDPSQVVLDEFAGFWVTAAFVPVPARFSDHTFFHAWLFTAGLYILFRATDTLKLPPCRHFEKYPWGWGILLDDIAAGIQANLIAQLLVRVIAF